MQLRLEAIKELQDICRTEYGREISEAEALEIGHRLLMLYELIHKPLPSELQATQPPSPAPPDDRAQEAR